LFLLLFFFKKLKITSQYQDGPNGRRDYDVEGGVVCVGTMEAAFAQIAPTATARHDFGAAFLTAGAFKFDVAAEDLATGVVYDAVPLTIEAE
jgi:hypothetical protein